MADIPFPTSSDPGIKPQDGGGRLINAYCTKSPQGARFPFQWRRTAGLRSALTLGHSVNRGMIEVGGYVLAAQQAQVYAITYSGGVYSSTALGNLTGSLPVTMAKNGKTPSPDIVCVTSEGGASVLSLSSAPVNYPDADLPTPNSVACHKNYFVFTLGDGRIFASDINSTAVSSSSYTTATGNLRRGVSFDNDFIAFGKDFFEIYRDVGATPFPFEFAGIVRRGLAGTHAVSGWEEGGADRLQWVADDDTVVRYNGAANPVVVSNDAVSRAIAGASDKSLLEASVYTVSGTSFWVLTSPSEWTWEMNLSSGEWNEKESTGLECWRARRTVRAFEKWLAGDRDTGDLYEIDPTYYKEGANALVWDVTSGCFAAFPFRLDSPNADFDFTAALGNAAGVDPIETNPRLTLYVSRDGGYSYGNGLLRNLGQQGQSGVRVRSGNMGEAKAKGYRVRLVVSDPVPIVFQGGRVPGLEQRAA